MLITDFIEQIKPKLIGRTYVKDAKLYMNFSGSGIKFKVLTRQLIIKLTGTKIDDVNARPIVSLLIDDKRTDYCIDSSNYVIDLNLSYEPHVIEILKRTESSVSFCAIKAIDAESFLDFREDKDLRIEFYGDSLTCGFGNLSKNAEEPFKTSTESFLEGYAYLTAKGLNADYSAICVSGFPVYKSRWNEGFKVISVADMLSFCDYYEDMGFDTCNYWNNAQFKPNLVVINLGANDHTYFTEGMKWIDELVLKYGDFKFIENDEKYLREIAMLKKRIIKFLDDLYALYGDNLKIIWCLFAVYFEDGVLFEVIKECVLNYPRKVYFYNIICQNNERGAAWHPNKVMHQEASEQLMKFIQTEVLGADKS